MMLLISRFVQSAAVLPALLLALLLACVSCADKPAAEPSSTPTPSSSSTPSAEASTASPAAAPVSAPPAGSEVYQVKGVVTEVLSERKKVRIAHEEIPGYMAAMTMLFDVKDGRELEGLEPGDEVDFRMIVTEDDGWIDQVKEKGRVSTTVTELPGNFRRVRDVEPLEIGDVMPDYAFTNETGQAVSLSEFKGRPYAFTFLFTRCPFPTFCPRMSTRLNEAYQALKANPDAPEGWHLFSITIDPEFDTPEVLKNYAQAYTYDPARWNYLTGALIDITAIGEQFGLQFYTPEPGQPGGINHNLRTVVVNAAGRVQANLVGNEWTAEELVTAMIAAGAAR